METEQQSAERQKELEAQMRDPHDGNTPAAWTAVIIMIVASAIGAWGLAVGAMPIFWLGVILVIVGVVAGKVMAMMGFGQYPKRS
ncbi:MAG: HGxxPAAW family protein [Candidatus Nanopelagicales bacterium]